MKRVYICEDDITGMLSAIYDAWKESRNQEAGIALRGTMEQQLFCEYTETESREKKAVAVEQLIQKNLGYNAYWDIYHALLSEDPQRAEAVFKVIQAARKIPNSKKIMDHLTNVDVAKVYALSKNVSNEAHQFIEFIRFRELENGVLFSEINPKNRVLTCIGDHFTNRFPLENWMVYDKTHKEFLVHQAQRRWVLVSGEEPNYEMIRNVSAAELEYEYLWKAFFQAIAIEERTNPVCQRGHLPIRFRQNMTEFQN